MNLCKYCHKGVAIENSHIIPASIYEWLKETSPTNYIRSTHEPNSRRQDGIKAPLLCSSCENIFSKSEEIFKKNFFNKIANYRKPCPETIKITPDIIKCIYIIAWRTLASTYYYPIVDNDYTHEEMDKFPEFLKKIKQEIDSEKYCNYRTHVIPCTEEIIAKLKLPQVERHIYERSITSEPRIWDSWERFIIYIQIPFCIIIFEIVPNTDDAWLGTQIEGLDHLVLPRIMSCPNYIGQLIQYYYEAFLKSKKTCQKRKKQIFKKAWKVPIKIVARLKQ